MFEKKLKVEPSIKVVAPETVKIEGIPETINVKGIPSAFTINVTLDVKSLPALEVKLPSDFKINLIGMLNKETEIVKSSPDISESIRERQAEKAEKINEVLQTKGEMIRRYRQRLWDKYLEADRRRQTATAATFKIKVDILDEIINMK